jgi:hypothetical protein
MNSMLFFIAYLIGASISGAIFYSIGANGLEKYKSQKYAECVDSVKIPVGECSKLFRGEK